MRLGAAAVVVLLAVGSEVGAEPIACQRAIAQAAAVFTQATTKALARCEQAKRQGKLLPSVVCAEEPKTVAAVAKAEAKLQAAIPAVCGGANDVCDVADVGGAADDTLAAIGWDVGTCPNFENGACTNPIDDCDGIVTCLACVGRAAVRQASELATGAFAPSGPRDPVSRCQAAIGRETAKYLAARAKALQKCEDLVLRGAIVGPCPTADAKTVAALAKAEASKVAKICKACGGADGACGGADDLTPAAIGFVSQCPGVTVPGAGSCAAPIATLDDLVACVDCVAAFKSACLDALAVPGLVAYPPVCDPAPTPTATPIPTVTPTPTVTATPPAGPVAVTCERAIVKEAGKLAQLRARALAACEARVLEGKLPLGTDCAAEPKTAAQIGKATSRFGTKIPKACGGANRVCDLGAGEPSLGEIGWGLAACPNFEGGVCDGPLADCDDVSGCLACIGDAAVAQAITLAYGFTQAAPGSPEAKCQAAIGKAATDYLGASVLALQKCADAQIRGRAAGPCPDPGDGKTVTAIAKAEQRLIGTVCKACGGADRFCGGGDDLSPASLGFAATCPDVVVPGGASCAAPVQTLDDLVACLACVATFKADCTDRAAIPDLRGYPNECAGAGGGTPTPTPTATPGGGGAICGNAAIEAGEACDDGNTSSCDACPADCRTAPVACPSTTVRHAQRVRLRAPDGALLQGAIACIQYPTGVVGLPGSGNVTGRTTGVSGLVTLNDFNDAVQLSFVINPAAAELNPTISFDLCTGAAPPIPTDFVCEMKSASNQGIPIEPPSLVECTAVAAP